MQFCIRSMGAGSLWTLGRWYINFDLPSPAVALTVFANQICTRDAIGESAVEYRPAIGANRTAVLRCHYLITFGNIFQCHSFVFPLFPCMFQAQNPLPLYSAPAGLCVSGAQKKRYEDEPNGLEASTCCSIRSMPGGRVSSTLSATISSVLAGSRRRLRPRERE